MSAPNTIAHSSLTQAAQTPCRSWFSPINQRRWRNFKRNRRAWWALWVFIFLTLFSFSAEFIANDRPIIASYKGQLLFPIFRDYPDSLFGGVLGAADFRDPFTQDELKQHGWAIWPPIHYSYNTSDEYSHSIAAPFWLRTREQNCALYPDGVHDRACCFGNMHLLGTDDRSRDIFARLIYGFRVSVCFTILLAIFSSVVGISVGAIQGYFGGKIDLIVQRLTEIWSSIPALFLIIIIAAVLTQGFWVLLGIMVLFQWVTLVSVVRAEFLRARNFEYVTAARALGAPDRTIILRHILPNAMVAALTYLPFMLTDGISVLTSLDYLGFGLPPSAASLGEIVRQGVQALDAPWIGVSAFITIAVLLSSLALIGQAIRDAFDPRKTFV